MLDRLDLRERGPPLYGSRDDRNLLPLEQVAAIDCCDFKCASLVPLQTKEYFWGKFEEAHCRNSQDAVLAAVLFSPTGGLNLCYDTIEAWFGVHKARVDLILNKLVEEGCPEIGRRKHRGDGHEVCHSLLSFMCSKLL